MHFRAQKRVSKQRGNYCLSADIWWEQFMDGHANGRGVCADIEYGIPKKFIPLILCYPLLLKA